MEVVERHPDSSDRRVINLVLSEKGRALLEEIKQRVKENVRLRLAGLTDNELTAMSSALEKLSIVVAKL
jgi:DNA-binding MarR family transcriptional regulator